MRWNRGPKVAIQIEWDSGKICATKLALSDSFCCVGGDDYLLEWLDLYSIGKPPPFPLPRANFSPFQQKAMQALCKIPFGKILSYQQLAILCGAPKSARAIGNACGKNPFPLLIPCHRVIRTGRKLHHAPLAFVQQNKSSALSGGQSEKKDWFGDVVADVNPQSLAACDLGGFAFDLEIKRRLLEFEILLKIPSLSQS